MKTKMLDSLVSRMKGQASTSDLIIELISVLDELETRRGELSAVAAQLPEVEKRLARLGALIKSKSNDNPFVRSLRE